MFSQSKGQKTPATTSTGKEDSERASAADCLDLSLVVPILKVMEPADPSDDVLVLARDESPVTRPFAADLIVMYAIDLPTHFRFVTYRELTDASISEEELHAVALRNLPMRLPEIEFHGEAPRYMVTAGGSFEATLLLLESLWEQVEEQMPGEILAAVPARDLLFVSASGWEGALPFMQDMTSRDFPEKRYALSTCVLARRDGEWVPHALAA
ncbi:DUF1444 family protein [Cupriavidus campinensis]|uniref:DUF1444 family protein n=1 Tax=Cupriavidus campinensis TaxID=151783 RepID=A0ABY3EMM8_9BURK|nr:DUF1444 family protein [Cupriavidus campinensis]TSP12225.1 DUF1444 family protein [Cupriavidus campinensis]